MWQVDDRQQIRRFAGRALAGGLSLAAAVAVLALLVGSFDETELRVVLSSISFGVASALGSAGASARLRPSEGERLLGTCTLIASAVAFALVLVLIWSDDGGSDAVARAFGSFAVAAFGGAHACVVLGAGRRSDGPAIRRLTRASLALVAIDTVGVILPITGLLTDVGEATARLFGASLVLLVLTTVLPPILRRTQAAAPAVAQSNGHGPEGEEFLAGAVVRIVDRIDALNSDPGNRAPEIRAELDRLRKLAQSFEN
jgi:hypothetical protein